MTRYHATPEGNIPFTAEEEAAWAAGADDREAEEVRTERNQLLLQTDWMASTDVTLSDAWRTYRQALRDVPAQSGFPNNVTWPTKPF